MMARILRPVVGIVGVVMLAVTTAYAVPLSASPPVDASVGNPLAGCPPDGSGTNFPDAEVEPWVEVNPTNGVNVVGVYQQDRYSNGGAKGMTAAVSFDGGVTWPPMLRCPTTPAARAASSNGRPTRGSPSDLMVSCTP